MLWLAELACTYSSNVQISRECDELLSLDEMLSLEEMLCCVTYLHARSRVSSQNPKNTMKHTLNKALL